MIKSGIPLIVLFFKLIERDSQRITQSVIISMVLLFCGQLLIYKHEVEFNWICFISSISALFTSGTKLFVIEKLLKHKKSSTSSSTSSSPSNGKNNNYNDGDICNEGENIKLNENIDDDNDETSAFIGIDSFSPAELILTDSEDGEQSYFYDMDTNNKYRENVELQIVETNKKNKVKVISLPIIDTNDTKKNFFKSILDKLSVDNIEESEDENVNGRDSGMNLIKKERKKVVNFTK